MENFKDFKKCVQDKFETMKDNSLFVVDCDNLWETYLSSFPEGTNKKYKERTEYDCQNCKLFIERFGKIVSIKNNNLISIWDIKIGGHFQYVADTLSKLVKSACITSLFYNSSKKLGTDYNHQLIGDSCITWQHFYLEAPSINVVRECDLNSFIEESKLKYRLITDSFEKISISSTEIVLDLISQKSIYKGEEYFDILEKFLEYQKEYNDVSNKDIYCWEKSTCNVEPIIRMKNIAIGTLLIDITNGMDLDMAVRLFEDKAAPGNYKKTSSVVTKKMFEEMQKMINNAGLEQSLYREHAIIDDIPIDNILFLNKTSDLNDNLFSELIKKAPIRKNSIKNLKKIDEVDINTFIKDILPNSKKVEILFENKHHNNLVSLIGPKYDCKNIFKWDNNFSWSYKGELTDSTKDIIREMGGNINGILRFSIRWNDNNDNQNDFDAHCTEPNGNLIYYNNKGLKHSSSGMLDVDIINPGNKPAVENIIWDDINKMLEGEYCFKVHNYSHCGGTSGFIAEIEYDGNIYKYEYNKELKNKETVIVAKINFSKTKGIEFIESLPNNKSTKEYWNINTNNFHNVKLITNSPNYWDNNKIGNKHYFFIIDDCINDKPTRGIYNEYLKNEFLPYRKAFDIVGSKLKVEKSNSQLSGLGFSSTIKNSLICKVIGSFTRTIKINF